MCAYKGWSRANGVENSSPAMTRDELKELMEKFPDGSKN